MQLLNEISLINTQIKDILSDIIKKNKDVTLFKANKLLKNSYFMRSRLILLLGSIYNIDLELLRKISLIAEISNISIRLHDDVENKNNNNNILSILLGDYLYTVAYSKILELKLEVNNNQITNITAKNFQRMAEAEVQLQLENNISNKNKIIIDKYSLLFKTFGEFLDIIINNNCNLCQELMSNFGAIYTARKRNININLISFETNLDQNLYKLNQTPVTQQLTSLIFSWNSKNSWSIA